MKRIAVASFIIGLAGWPIQAEAQQLFAPPILTQAAADCALDLIEFMDTTVRGFDLINATDDMRIIWRNYLAANYPRLALEDQIGFANACVGVANVNAVWPQTPPMVRESYRQVWAASLPPLLQFIAPVVRAAQQQTVQNVAPRTPQNPVEQLQSMRDSAASLSQFNTRMTNNTINLMHAMSGH